MRIVILAAFQDELAYIKKGFSNLVERKISICRCLHGRWKNDEIFISLTGIGTSSSAITASILCENLNPDLIIFAGVAGGLKSEQQIGDLVLASKIIDADLLPLPQTLENTPYKRALVDPHNLKLIKTHYLIHPSITHLVNSFSFERLKKGVIVTSNIFPAPKSLFPEIKHLNCSAIEMESAGIFKVAELFDIPAITLRAISNLLDEDGNDLGTQSTSLQTCSQHLASCLEKLLQHLECEKLSINNKKLPDSLSGEELEYLKARSIASSY